MNEFIWLYAYTSLSTVKGLMSSVTVAGFGTTIVLILIIIVEKADALQASLLRIYKFKTVRAWIIITMLLVIFVPSRSEITTIIGGGLAWKATQIEGIETIPKNLVNVMNTFLIEINEKEK